jgi:quercetin dioxygenase-like cupin family protein
MFAACGAPQPAPAQVVPVEHDAGVAVAIADAPAASDDEKLAAIQKAMNDLAPAAQQCWAAAAASERFDIAGAITAQIDIAAQSRATLVQDSAVSSTLSACLTKLLEAYRWAPPLAGQTIQLPFAFRKVDGQSVIDRRLVPEHAQGKTSIAVLVDEANTGNAAASMLGVTLAGGATTGMRAADRDQLWYVTANDATVNGAVVAPGDMMFVPKGGTFEVAAKAGELHAVVVLVPGGKEGSARAGALPNRDAAGQKPAGAIVLHARDAKSFCFDHSHASDCAGVEIFAEPSTIRASSLAASHLHAGNVPPHAHASETELLYVESGGGMLALAGTNIAVTESSVVQVPPGLQHAFTGTLTALQIYTPAGPEQRFKK